MADAINQRILTEMQSDPRITMSELGRRVGLSAPAVTERVQRLERSGVIVGYRLEIDPAALGFPVSAYVRIRPGPGQLRRIADLAASIPEVTECHRITGEDCFIMRVYAPALDQFEAVLDKFLMHGQTTSSIVQSTAVPARPLPLPHL
ncbi:MAG TPA: Lrp/AsnC family transcriptional regulator [Streptosporangiaceae bacterium]|nr:Lrp/AsnC family transcriptional regulator [Streptosporangiaceae bacterium]